MAVVQFRVRVGPYGRRHGRSELRSPLAGARALLETEVSDPDEVAETRAEVLATLARLEVIVEQLLAGGAANRGEATVGLRLVDLDELVLAQARRIERTTDVRVDRSAVSGGQVRGHENDLGRLVENLAANAVRHADTAVRFEVSQDSSGAVTFVVADDGGGVPVASRDVIFGRFTRLDEARVRDAGGAGLGLAIVASIIDRHGGRIEVGDSALGGAEFRVTFPSRP